MKSIKSLILVTIFSISIFSACSDKKKESCNKAYKMIKKCMPNIAVNKKQHIRVCKDSFNKSSTQGTVECAQTFSDCGKFKVCLTYSAKCSDYKGAKFKLCLNNAPQCSVYKARKFKACVKCITDKHKDGDELKDCILEDVGEKEVAEEPVKTPKPADMAPAMGTTPEKKPDAMSATPPAMPSPMK